MNRYSDLAPLTDACCFGIQWPWGSRVERSGTRISHSLPKLFRSHVS